MFHMPDPRHVSMTFFCREKYLVGSEDGADAEKLVREIELAPFWIDQTHTTNEQFGLFVAETGFVTEAEAKGFGWGWHEGAFQMLEALSWRSYAGPGRKTHPVVLVSWNDAKAYAAWAGKRLPTEWEWEVAASCASGFRYPWGEAEPTFGHCNWNRTPAALPPTEPVRSFQPNKCGLFEMVGNVWQWCDNFFDGSNDGLRSRRGGAWNVIQDFRLRCANRGAMVADSSAPNLGFRCAKSA